MATSTVDPRFQIPTECVDQVLEPVREPFDQARDCPVEAVGPVT